MKLFRCGPSVPSACGGSVEATAVAVCARKTITSRRCILKTPPTCRSCWIREILRGRWRTAAFVHSRLMPAEHPRSTTTLVLISDMPPAEAVME